MKLYLGLGLLCFFFCIPKLQGAESPVDKSAGRKPKPKPKCLNPRGNVGDSLLNGCDKRTCIQIKNKADWHEEFAYESCCWQNQTAYKIGETFSTSKDPDTGIDTTMRCDQTSSGSPHIVVDVSAENCNVAEQVNEISESVKQTNNELKVTNSKIENIENELQVTNSKVGNIEKLLNSVLHIIQTGESKTTTTQTTPTTTTAPFPILEGVLIAGGHHTDYSAELFLPHTDKTCLLKGPGRSWSSLDSIGNKTILCGGYHTPSTCLQFLQTSSTGSWVNYANLNLPRFAHTTHVFKGEKDVLMLVGGHHGPATTEILGSGRQYDLEQDGSNFYDACSIPDQSTYILTGGKNSESGYLKTVAVYDIKEFVENLPDLPKARGHHGCGLYTDKTNTKVLVVAGGLGNDGYLSSTELLPSGATSWISGEPLPRTLNRMSSVTMDNYILLIGGQGSGGTQREIFMFNGNWSVVGNMKNARYVHAATQIQVGEELDISACL